VGWCAGTIAGSDTKNSLIFVVCSAEFILRNVDAFVRNPDTKVLKNYFDPTEDVAGQQDDLITKLLGKISLHFNNSGSQAREKMWANNLKMFVQENADVKLTRDYARNFFNYVKNQGELCSFIFDSRV
jgi:hypothetical protein